MKNFTLVFGDMPYDAERDTIECPPSTVKNKIEMPNYGIPMRTEEIVLQLGEHTFIKDNEQGRVRINNRLKTIMVSKESTEKEAKQVVKKYMNEKGITTIEEVIEQSKKADLEQRKAKLKQEEEQTI